MKNIFITVAIKIYSKFARNVTKIEERACKRMVTTGVIYNVYSDCYEDDSELRDRVFIAKDGDKCVAWAVIHELKKKDLNNCYFEFMVYVKQKYRRKKIGTKLYKKAKKYFDLRDEEIKVYNTDNRNSAFYENLRGKEVKTYY